MILRPYQAAAIDAVRANWRAGRDRVLLVAPVGAGKCLHPDERVLMHDGTTKRSADVITGDLLQGPDGPRTVLSTTTGRGPLYRIVPVKGKPWVCNDVHVLTLIRTGTNKVIDIPLDQFLKLGRTTQAELKLFIPAGGVDFAPQPEPMIDPYFMGLWYGDGSKALTTVAVSKPDPEVQETCEQIAAAWGLHVRRYDGATCPTYAIVNQRGLGNPLLNALRLYVGDGSTIPDSLRYGSRAVRAAFLAGFLDSDGHLDHGGFDIVQKAYQYAETIAFVARSLGLRASEPTSKIVNGQVYWRVSISGDASWLPLRIPRKRPGSRLQKKDATRTGFRVEPIGVGDYAGFTLDGDGRFLLADFTVTHNTAIAEEMITMALARSPNTDIYFLAHRVELLEQPARRFQKRGILYGIVKAGVPPRPDRRVQIASVQTLCNRPAIAGEGRSALVFVDEGHRVKAQTYQRILRELRQTYEHVYVVYLTATPYRLDGQGLGDVSDALVEATTPRKLIAEGFITEGQVIGRPPPEKIDTRAVDSDGEFLEDAAEQAMDRPKLIGDSVDTWRKHCDGWPGLGRCVTKRSALARAEAFKAAGFRVGYLDGETPQRERQMLLARLAIGGQRSAHPMGLDVLFFVNVLTEGYDSESSYELVLNECKRDLWMGRSYPPEYVPLCVLGDYAPTQSMGAFIQFWGRGSRVHARKPWLKLLSHAGNEDTHCYLSQHEGFTLEHRQSEWLSKMREREAAQGVAVSSGAAARVVCADCQTRWLAGTVTCLHCGGTNLGPLCGSGPGADGVGLEGDEEAPGELVEKAPDAEAPRPPTPFETESWFTAEFTRLRAENARRVSDGKPARKVGSIVYRYRGIFKRDPDWAVYNRYRKQYGFTG